MAEDSLLSGLMQASLSLVFVVLLIVAFGFLMKWLAAKKVLSPLKQEGARVLSVQNVDRHHKAVTLAWRGTEYLILTGDKESTVVGHYSLEKESTHGA